LNGTESGLPPYLLEAVARNLAALIASGIERYSVESFVRGALRTIGDAVYDMEDPVVQELCEIDDALGGKTGG
jgi:hypothetical protein